MEVTVNKKNISIPNGSTLNNLLKDLKYTKSVAVFINGKQLFLGQYENFKLNENDNIRIIKPLGGG